MSKENTFSVISEGLEIDENNRTIRVVPKLSQKAYAKVKAVLTRMGGKWDTQTQCFSFAKSPTALVDRILEFGSSRINRFHFYPTPDSVFQYMENFTPLTYVGASGKAIKVLEPEAGDGGLIQKLKAFAEKNDRKYEISGYEIDELNVELCQSSGLNVQQADFLEVQPEPIYDLVVMNPPFQGTTFIKHIKHAHKFLNEKGILISVIPTAWLEREPSQLESWLVERALLRSSDDLNERFEPGTFANTDVETCIITLESEAMQQRQLSSKAYKDKCIDDLYLKVSNCPIFCKELREVENSEAPTKKERASQFLTKLKAAWNSSIQWSFYNFYLEEFSNETNLREDSQLDLFS